MGACDRGIELGNSRDKIVIDGSGTVYPLVSALGDDFVKSHTEVNLVLNKSGTGSGIQKFSRGEIDIAAASRPVEAKETQALANAHVEFIELPFAYDGVTVIVSAKNSWAKRMNLDDLKRAWRPDSPVIYWSDIRPNWPRRKIQFYGPTDNHGTYDYFTEAINQKEGAIRSDVQTNQEYNAIVQGVADDEDGIGYVGLSYFADNRDKVRAVGLDTGLGAIVPSYRSVSLGSYSLLSRPLFLYINKRSYDQKAAVRAFVEFVLSERGRSDIDDAHFVRLPDSLERLIKTRAKKRLTGTLFAGSISGLSLSYVAKVEQAATR
jgi:phosphate transport system substrate-binding protein